MRGRDAKPPPKANKSILNMRAARSNSLRCAKKSRANPAAVANKRNKRGLIERDILAEWTLRFEEGCLLWTISPKRAATRIANIGLSPYPNIPAATATMIISLQFIREVLPNNIVALATIATTII